VSLPPAAIAIVADKIVAMWRKMCGELGGENGGWEEDYGDCGDGGKKDPPSPLTSLNIHTVKFDFDHDDPNRNQHPPHAWNRVCLVQMEY
jgi:hypothetical protein